MKKISSRMTFFHKKLFPIVWFGFLAFFFLTIFSNGSFLRDPFLLVVPCLMLVIGFFVFKKLIWNLADEVYDCGDYLLVKKGPIEERVMINNIMNVSSTILMNPPRISLRLVQPGIFGDEIVFSPAAGFRINPFAKNVIAEELMIRVDQSRRASVYYLH